MTTRLTVRILLLVAVLAAAGGCAPSAGPRTPTTVPGPAPTGSRPVGVVDLHLDDPSRPGVGPVTAPAHGREVMVSVWYPARSAGEAPPAAWLPAPTARYLAEQLHATAGVPVERWRLGPLAAGDRPAAARLPRRPLVLLSPGYGMVRGLYSGLAEDLASRGFVVAAVDHPGDAGLVTLPDGRLQRQVALDQDDSAAVRAAVTARADDLRLVLDRLDALRTGARPGDTDARPLPAGLAGLLDPDHVVGVGHSLGGPTVMAAMLTDPRVGSAVDLDGSLYPPVTDGVARPVLAVTGEGHGPGNDPSWRRWCEGAHPPADSVTLPGAAHLSFTDLTDVLPVLRAAGLVSATATINTVGPLDPALSRRHQTEAVVGWLDRTGRSGPGHPITAARPASMC